MRAFLAKGLQQTSMADIIAESGLSAGAFYGHFTSKQEVILEVARRTTTNRLAELADVTSRDELPEPGEVLRTILTGLAADIDGDTRLLVQVWGMAMVDERVRALALEVFTDLREAYRGYFVAWATQRLGMSEADADAWASRRLPVMLGLGQGFILQAALDSGFDREQYLQVAGELLAG
jgi:AcrR family transcriptional regulator